MFRRASEIREAYRDVQVAESYVDQRFREPLGALLHDRQVAALKRVVAALKPRRVLELAPGPARITTDIAPALAGARLTVVDTSAQMLSVARRRLNTSGQRSVRFAQGDAFALPFRGEFDLVYTFRLIRHFDDRDRQRIYRQIARVLRPGGMLVFDAVNETVSAPLRAKAPAEYSHYDALLRPARLSAELAGAGFQLNGLLGLQHHYELLEKLQVTIAPRSRPLARGAMELVERVGRGEPLEWVVTCRRA